MSNFEQMIDDLKQRGLLDAAGDVTPAGEAYTDQLIEDLREADPPADAIGGPVVWNTGKKAWA